MHDSSSSASSVKDVDSNTQASLRLTKFGWFVTGLFAGELLALLITYVVSVTGVFSGVALILGFTIILGTIGVNLEENK